MPVSEDLLRDGIRQLGLPHTPAMVQCLLAYAALLEKWDRVYNLGARASLKQPTDFLRRHLLDSLSISPLLSQQTEQAMQREQQGVQQGEQGQQTGQVGAVLDVGTGAGLPGLPLAVLNPQREFILLDSDGKKTCFLQQVHTELGINNVHIVKSRVEHYHPPPRLGMVLCRAFAPLSRLAAAMGRVLTAAAKATAETTDATGITGVTGVPLLVMCGRQPPAVIPGFRVARVQRLTVPGLTHERHALLLYRAQAQ